MLQDVLVLPHGGGPMAMLGEPSHKGLTDWLATVPATLPRPPTAVLVISAHWEATEPTVLSSAAPELLFDYFGFPQSAYELAYPARGAPLLAEQLQQRLRDAGFVGAAQDVRRGYDHGVFIPLLFMFPRADVPVLQLSLLASLDAREHLRLGRAIAPLRAQGVLIVGSGMHSFHNMRGFRGAHGSDPIDASRDFDAWIVTAVTAVSPAERERLLGSWEALAPRARDVHPREEHLLPLLVCAGAAGESVGVRVLATVLMGTQASALAFRDGQCASGKA
ncbi:hypothetical protein KFE25_001252 [Diacronema lutheri]|uniref:Extradiol ring-cleavage dioxygenase class III enzyme subunit B domain-containing protein n=2 Tax=Diacronema lutheri TaxID=2081491 RepID=A0A7R9V1G5_DIALT|nr:hypothetical protein KFE25_001252 [Diacronema lutheri]|mmetsp:Transcript_9681/g.30661  ORF Transcript_9681/g.30661 Transcript_9681/m.30661 type:complete len:277 (+) Transcript_9681:37-867(+)